MAGGSKFSGNTVQKIYAEATLTGGGVTTISTSSEVHAWYDGSTAQGELNGDIAFHAGSTGAITSTADNTVLRCTDVGHGLTTGDVITLVGMGDAAHNGITAITKIDDDTFDCDDITFNSGADTGTWLHPDHFKIGAAAQGTLQVLYTASAAKAAGATALFEFSLYVGTTLKHKIQRQIPGTDTGAFALSGITDVVEDDEIWIGVTNTTNTDNITIGEASFNIHSI